MQGEGMYPAPTHQRIQQLDADLARLSKSTRATLPAMVPIHDILRHKFRWYYKWHLNNWSSAVHLVALIGFIGVSALVFYNLIFQTPSYILAASQQSWKTPSDWGEWQLENIEITTDGLTLAQDITPITTPAAEPVVSPAVQGISTKIAQIDDTPADTPAVETPTPAPAQDSTPTTTTDETTPTTPDSTTQPNAPPTETPTETPPAAVTYRTWGRATLTFSPKTDEIVDWLSSTQSEDLQGQTIQKEFSTDNILWTKDLSELADASTVYLRLTFATNNPAISPLLKSFVLNYSRLPQAPTNLGVEGNWGVVGFRQTLTAGAFLDPDGDFHKASQWQVSKNSGAYKTPLIDSGASAKLTEYRLPQALDDGTYYFRVRYQDTTGAWGLWSEEASFTLDGNQITYLGLGEVKKYANEIVAERTETSKTIDNQNGSKTLISFSGVAHYKENYNDPNAQWKDINPKHMVDKPEYVLFDQLPSTVKIYKDKIGYEIESRKTGEKYTVELQDVDGQPNLSPEPSEDGLVSWVDVNGSEVELKDKIPALADLILPKVMAQTELPASTEQLDTTPTPSSSLTTTPTTTPTPTADTTVPAVATPVAEEDSNLKFEFEVGESGVRLWKTIEGETAPRNFKWKVTKTGAGDTLQFRENPEAFEVSTSGEDQPEKQVEIQTSKVGTDNSFIWTETAPQTNLKIDTDVTYYSGVGDGWVEVNDTGGYWDLCYDATDGTDFDYTSATAEVESYWGGISGGGGDDTCYISRAFLPFNTAALPDDATIDSATLGVYFTSDSTTGVNITAGTTQASPTALEAADFDTIGSVEGDFGTITTGQYNTVEFLTPAFVSVDGYTLMGLQDMDDDATEPGPGVTYNATFSTSEETGTGQDPYLAITYTPAGVEISGTVYTAEDKLTNIGASKTIGLSINGGAKTTVETTAGGAFSFTGQTVAADNTITLFIDDETENGTLVTQAIDASSDITGLEMYTDKVVLRHETAGPMTNTLLATADNSADDDIRYSMSGSDVTFTSGYELFIEATMTYTPGAAVTVDDIDINGTFVPSSNTINVGGSWDATGGALTNASSTITFNSTASETIKSDSESFNNITFNGSGGTWTAQDALSAAATLTLTQGTFDANAKTVTIVNLTASGASTRVLTTGAGIWNVSGNWDTSGSNQTITMTGSTVNLTGAGGSTQTINGSTTFVNLSATATAARTITFTAGTTQTVTGTWTATGSADQLLTLNSTAASAWSIDPTAWSVDYVNPVYSTNLAATPINPTHYTDGGNNVNWFPAVPTAPSGVTIDTAAVDGFTAHWTDNSSDETNFNVYISTVANADCSLATYGGVPDYEPIADAESQVVSGKSVNVQYCAKVTAENAAGESTPAYAAAPLYTLANVPSAPTVNTPTTTSLKVIINVNSNPASTEFAIYNETLTKYVGADGVADEVAEVWQDYATWGGASGIINTGLSASTLYSYTVKARNGDNVATAMSAAGSATTLASGVTISGTVYTAEDKLTNIGADKTIGLSINGGVKTTVESTAGGAFEFTGLTVAADNTITIFIDDESGLEANLVTQAIDGATDITGLELYTDKIVLTHETAGPMTNTLLNTANNSADDDIHYTDDAAFDTAYELFIEATKTYTPGGTVTSVGDFDLNGIFVPANNTVNIYGSWDSTGGTFTSTDSTITFASTAAGKTIISGGESFNNITFSGLGGEWALTDATDVNGNLAITDGTVTFPATTLNVFGSFTNSGGTFIHNSGTVIFDGTAAGKTITSGSDFHDLTISGTGAAYWTTQDNLNGINTLTINSGTLDAGSWGVDVEGDYSQVGGIFIAPSSPNILELGANFTHTAGAFTHNSGEVVLNGTNHIITGDTTFNDLSSGTPGAKTITFAAGSTQTIEGAWTVAGTAGNLVTLQSSAAAVWFVDPASWAVSYVDVSYSTNLAATIINPTNSNDGGNNTNWFYAAPDVTLGVVSTWDAAGEIDDFTLDNVQINGETLELSASEGVTYTSQFGNSGGDGQLHGPASTAVDLDGNIYVADYSNSQVKKYSNTGTYILKTAVGQLTNPAGVAVDASNNFYVTDVSQHKVKKYSSTGVYISQFGTRGSGNGQFTGPTGIAIDSSGNIYVADTGNDRIQKFTSAGVYVTKWGSKGTGNGQFKEPRGIAIDSSSNIYVVDSKNNRVQKFSSTGTYITKWGSNGGGDGQFRVPYGVEVNATGNVFVTELNNHRIQKFSNTGTFVTKWGTWGSGDGQFYNPKDLAFDADSNIYVADYFNNRIQKFSSATTGTATLSGANSTIAGSSWLKLSWETTSLPAGTSVKARVRASDTLPVSGTWSDYVTVSGNDAHLPGGSTHPTGQYADIEYTLTSVDGIPTTPVLDSMTVDKSAGGFPENGGSAIVRSILSAITDQAVVVNLAFSGDAAKDTDYTADNSITVPMAALTEDMTVSSINDPNPENDEIAYIDIDSIIGGTEDGTQQVGTRIIDNDFSITASAGAGGSITPSGAVGVEGGTDQAFTISADPGYDIADVAVNGDSVSAISAYNFPTVSANQTIAATFVAQTRYINVYANEFCTVTPDGPVESVTYGDNISFTIAPISAAYAIEDVLVDGVSQGAIGSYDFINVTTNHYLEATCRIQTFYVDVTNNGNGTIAPAGPEETVEYGNNLSFTFTPDAGYYIAEVKVDGGAALDPTPNSYEFTNVIAHHTLEVTFEAIPTVTLSVNNASIAEAAGTSTVTATLSNSFSDTVTVTLAYSGTATNTTDYTRSGASIAIAAGETSGTVTLTAVQDYVQEDDETIIVDISAVTNGTESGSQTETVTITDDEPTSIANPTNFTGVAGESEVTLSWTNPSTIYFSYVEIYRSTASGTLGSKITQTSGTGYIDTGLTNDTTYYYTLKAVDILDNISTGTEQLALKPTSDLVLDIIAPGTPTLRITNTQCTEVDLAWSAVTDNTGVVGYRLYNNDTNVQIAATGRSTATITGLQPDTTYNFYVRAYDAAGNLSEKSNIVTTTTLDQCEPTLITEIYLIIGNAPAEVVAGNAFPRSLKVMAVDGGGAIVKGYSDNVFFTSSDQRARLEWSPNNPYRFTSSDAGSHEFAGSGFVLKTVGAQKLTVSDGQVKGSVEVNVLPAELPEIFQKAQETVTNLIANLGGPDDKIAIAFNTAIITALATLLALPLIINTLLGFTNLGPQLLYWMTHLFQLIGFRRRRQPWGTVFNSQTGQPVPYATIKLFDKEYNRLLETAVTDSDGRFGFLVKDGSYYLTAQKASYTFPSAMKVSSYFEHVYTGGTIEIKKGDRAITYNIPLDPKVKLTGGYKFMVGLIKTSRFLNKLRPILLGIGLLMAIILVIRDYNIFYLLSVVFYVLIAVWELMNLRRARPYGLVTDTFGEPLDMSIVRIYDKRHNRLYETDVTDKEGRFKFLVNPGVYYITAIKPNYIDFKSHIMYLEKERTMVSVNIKLKKPEKR